MELLACDDHGVCGVCKLHLPEYHLLQCDSCSCFWHMACLCPPLTSVPDGMWECPDCAKKPVAEENKLVKSIWSEKEGRRQQLLIGAAGAGLEEEDGFRCMICNNPLNHPVTTPCGHNCCLTCLKRWFASPGGKKCMKCRAGLDKTFMEQPRINFQLVNLIKSGASSGASRPKPVQLLNDDRTERAYLTAERAERDERIFVTVPRDFFGPITAAYDPVRGRGVLVGDTWDNRMDCRQWGAHRPQVAGIAGQSGHGAQSVALSGGFIDDEDHGEWFLYTGSGGREITGSYERTNSSQSSQSSDQKLTLMNKALAMNCMRGYPIRVVRSDKEKRSAFAPQSGVRYDGIYKIERFWRTIGVQGYLVFRYLFVRCDNEPAPWTSDRSGDRPRSLPYVDEIAAATDVKGPLGPPAWDWMEDEGAWGWVSPPPPSKIYTRASGIGRSLTKFLQWKLTNEFTCGICENVLQRTLSTPCGHHFCESCLVERSAQRNLKFCPKCHHDITEFMVSPAVNMDMEEMIDSIAKESKRARKAGAGAELVVEALGGSEDEEEALEGEEEGEGSQETGTNTKMDLVCKRVAARKRSRSGM